MNAPLLNIDGNHAVQSMEQYEDAVKAIFDSAYQNRVETAVLLAAIEGLTKVGAQHTNISNCTFKGAK